LTTTRFGLMEQRYVWIEFKYSGAQSGKEVAKIQKTTLNLTEKPKNPDRKKPLFHRE